MTQEDKHQYNKTHVISSISYKAMCTTDAVIAFREWLEQWLAAAYEAGFNNAREGEL